MLEAANEAARIEVGRGTDSVRLEFASKGEVSGAPKRKELIARASRAKVAELSGV